MSEALRAEAKRVRHADFLRQAGEAISRGDDFFRRVLDALPAAVYIADAAGTIIFYNDAAAALWGHRPQLGEGQWCGSWKLYWPDGRALPHGECPMAIALQESRPVGGMEAIAERPDGTRVPFVAYPTPFYDASGALLGAVNMLVDITDRKRAEEDAQRLAAIIKSSDDAIIGKDLNGVINSWNRGAERLFGYTAEDVIGKSITILIPADRQDEEPFILDRIRRGELVDHYETVRRRKDGMLVDIALTTSPIKDSAGRIVGASKIARDITDRKRAQEHSQRLASIVESSDDAIISKDLNGVITSWNRGAERLYGYKAEEVLGQPITILIPADRQDEEPEILARLRRGEQIDHYETVRKRKDGALLDVALTASPIKNEQGKIVGASKIARDITYRRQGEEQQQLLLREMDHRVNNLFALANSVVALSARSAATPKELASAVSERLGALARAHALTLPKASHPANAGDQSTTLHALIQTIVSPYESPLGGGRARVAISGPDSPVGSGSATSFALLLHEFATNAAKYGALSEPTGHVDIACSEDADRFIVTWRERGGPPVQQSASEGFGTLIASATVKSQMGGEIARDWDAEGLTIRLSVARERLAR
jgi:PAS domain S-box-containing protein